MPEPPSTAVPLALFAVLAVSVYLLRKRNLNAPADYVQRLYSKASEYV